MHIYLAFADNFASNSMSSPDTHLQQISEREGGFQGSYDGRKVSKLL